MSRDIRDFLPFRPKDPISLLHYHCTACFLKSRYAVTQKITPTPTSILICAHVWKPANHCPHALPIRSRIFSFLPSVAPGSVQQASSHTAIKTIFPLLNRLTTAAPRAVHPVIAADVPKIHGTVNSVIMGILSFIFPGSTTPYIAVSTRRSRNSPVMSTSVIAKYTIKADGR